MFHVAMCVMSHRTFKKKEKCHHIIKWVDNLFLEGGEYDFSGVKCPEFKDKLVRGSSLILKE